MRLSTISHTAWLVMLCQIALHNDKRWHALVIDEDAAFYQACLDYCHRNTLLYKVVDLIPHKQHLWLIERLLAKGAPQHFALRKQVTKKQAEECIKNGVTQIVVIGGGFDPLALHMARCYPEVHCFEFDMPTMHNHKMNIACAQYGVLPGNFFGMGEDLSEKSLQALLSNHPAFEKSKPTLFIAEGLTMYLSAAAVEELFRSMRELCNGWASVLFTASEPPKPAGNIFSKYFQKVILTLSNENFSWNKPHNEMPEFLRQQKFIQQYLLSYADLQQPWRTSDEMASFQQASNEYIVYATGQGS